MKPTNKSSPEKIEKNNILYQDVKFFHHWINISEKLPEEDVFILLMYENGIYFGSRFGDSFMEDSGSMNPDKDFPTHWQPVDPSKGWVNINDELPEDDVCVLLKYEDRIYFGSKYGDSFMEDSGSMKLDEDFPTHWQSINL